MGDHQVVHRSKLFALLLPLHERARLTARRLCRSDSEGDDLFQDAVLHALPRIDQLRDEAAFYAWFYRILLSLHRSRQRRSLWRRLLPLDVLTSPSRQEEPIGDDGRRWEDRRASAARIREALSTLPAVQREAIVLFEVDGYSLSEVAELQNASVSSVKTRLTRGRARLEKHYTTRYLRSPARPRSSSEEISGLSSTEFNDAEGDTP